MAIADPAQALVTLLNPGGSWDGQLVRSGGTYPGTIQAVNCWTPTPPYDGPAPALFISSVPERAQLLMAGAGCWQVRGTLECFYLDRLPTEQGTSPALVDAAMAANVDAIFDAILGSTTLAGAIVGWGTPLEVLRDPHGIVAAWEGAPWVYAVLRLPFIGQPF